MAETRSILARTGKDAHNVVFTKDALESAAEGANGDRAARMVANHDPFCMPYGKIVEAWVEPKGSHHVLVARMYVEDNVTQLIREKTGEQLALLDFAKYPKPFNKSFENESHEQTEVHVDFVNFDSKQNYDSFLNEVKKIGDGLSCGRGFGRKSLIPGTVYTDRIVKFGSRHSRISNRIVAGCKGKEIHRPILSTRH